MYIPPVQPLPPICRCVGVWDVMTVRRVTFFSCMCVRPFSSNVFAAFMLALCCVLQCSTVCCSVFLTFKSVLCSVLQCVSVCCSVAVCGDVLQYVAVCVWHPRGRGAVCCSVLQYSVLYCVSDIQIGTVQCVVVCVWHPRWRCAVSCSVLRYSILQCVAIQHAVMYFRHWSRHCALCCSVLQCVFGIQVDVVQYVAVCCSVFLTFELALCRRLVFLPWLPRVSGMRMNSFLRSIYLCVTCLLRAYDNTYSKK